MVTKNTMQLTLIHWWCAKSSIGLLLSIDSSLMLVVACKGAEVVLWCIFSRNLWARAWIRLSFGLNKYLVVWVDFPLTIELDGLNGFYWYRWLLFGCSMWYCVVVMVCGCCVFGCRVFCGSMWLWVVRFYAVLLYCFGGS